MPRGNKPNPFLNALEARKEAECRARLDRLNEIDLIAHILSCHEDLGVGPGRAERVLHGFLESKMEVANAIVKESNEDSKGEFPVTQRDLAKQMRDILGPDNWKKYQYMFPILKAYWDMP